MPGAGGLVAEIKSNTQHYLSVIAEAADAQLATLSVTGAVPADVYDTLLEAVSSVPFYTHICGKCWVLCIKYAACGLYDTLPEAVSSVTH
jgi:hypothetical protein